MFELIFYIPVNNFPVMRFLVLIYYEGQSKITESWLISFYWVGTLD